jgi:hypothetical protein
MSISQRFELVEKATAALSDISCRICSGPVTHTPVELVSGTLIATSGDSSNCKKCYVCYEHIVDVSTKQLAADVIRKDQLDVNGREYRRGCAGGDKNAATRQIGRVELLEIAP